MKKGIITEIEYHTGGYQRVKINGKQYVSYLDLIKYPNIKIGGEVYWEEVSKGPTTIINGATVVEDLISVTDKKK